MIGFAGNGLLDLLREQAVLADPQVGFGIGYLHDRWMNRQIRDLADLAAAHRAVRLGNNLIGLLIRLHALGMDHRVLDHFLSRLSSLLCERDLAATGSGAIAASRDQESENVTDDEDLFHFGSRNWGRCTRGG